MDVWYSNPHCSRLIIFKFKNHFEGQTIFNPDFLSDQTSVTLRSVDLCWTLCWDSLSFGLKVFSSFRVFNWKNVPIKDMESKVSKLVNFTPFYIICRYPTFMQAPKSVVLSYVTESRTKINSTHGYFYDDTTKNSLPFDPCYNYKRSISRTNKVTVLKAWSN